MQESNTGHLHQCKDNHYILLFLPQRIKPKSHVLEAAYSTPRNMALPLIQKEARGYQLWLGPKQERTFQKIQALVPTGSNIVQGITWTVLLWCQKYQWWEKMLHGVCERITRQHLGFWSGTLPSAEDNYTPFVKQLLSCFLALIEHKHDHEPQVTMHLKLPIMSWFLSDSPSFEVSDPVIIHCGVKCHF